MYHDLLDYATCLGTPPVRLERSTHTLVANAWVSPSRLQACPAACVLCLCARQPSP
jgi:hypothetical protein